MATDNGDPQTSEKRFKDTVTVCESVEVKTSGKWEGGGEFEAYDYIRVINPPMIQLPPRFRNPSPIVR